MAGTRGGSPTVREGVKLAIISYFPSPFRSVAVTLVTLIEAIKPAGVRCLFFNRIVTAARSCSSVVLQALSGAHRAPQSDLPDSGCIRGNESIGAARRFSTLKQLSIAELLIKNSTSPTLSRTLADGGSRMTGAYQPLQAVDRRLLPKYRCSLLGQSCFLLLRLRLPLLN